jgi:hypothetical protein
MEETQSPKHPLSLQRKIAEFVKSPTTCHCEERLPAGRQGFWVYLGFGVWGLELEHSSGYEG